MARERINKKTVKENQNDNHKKNQSVSTNRQSDLTAGIHEHGFERLREKLGLNLPTGDDESREWVDLYTTGSDLFSEMTYFPSVK